MKRRTLILDRDGVINIDTGYLHRIEDCAFIEGIFEMVQAFHERGFTIIVATNQAGIGRGYYSEAEFKLFMDWMRDRFDGKIAAVYHCPDHPEGIGVYRRENPWRKPGSGMLLKAAQDFDLDLTRSWMVGDKETDLEAARRASIGHIVLLDCTTTITVRRGDYWRVPSLAAVTALLHGAPDMNLSQSWRAVALPLVTQVVKQFPPKSSRRGRGHRSTFEPPRSSSAGMGRSEHRLAHSREFAPGTSIGRA